MISLHRQDLDRFTQGIHLIVFIIIPEILIPMILDNSWKYFPLFSSKNSYSRPYLQGGIPEFEEICYGPWRKIVWFKFPTKYDIRTN